jgi:hypothetical protein
MDDENELRYCARQALRAGKLPPGRPDRMWGGRGAGALCSVCNKPVEPSETGFDLEFSAPGHDAGRLINHPMHLRCFAAWEFERQSYQPVSCASSAPPDHRVLSSDRDVGTIASRECNAT